MSNKNNVSVTVHGEKRSRKRAGIPKDKTAENAQKAYECGVHVNEATGTLKKYMNYRNYVSGYVSDVVVYNGFIYIFRDMKLVTTFPLPGHMVAKAHEAQTRKNEKQNKKSSDEGGADNA